MFRKKASLGEPEGKHPSCALQSHHPRDAIGLAADARLGVRTAMALNLETIPELSGVKTTHVPLKRIRAGENMQPRVLISEDTIRRYKDTLRNAPTAPFPPILLGDLGEAPGERGGTTYTVIDGFHRYKAHEELRRERIMARIIRCSRERAEWLAALANMHHGLPLKRGDQRRVFRRYVCAGENRHRDSNPKSYREIVEDLSGLRSIGTIHKWMQQDFPGVAAEMADRDGPIEEDAPKEPTTSYAVAKLKEFSLALTRIARLAAKEDKERGREAVLEWSLFLTENLARTIGIEPSKLYEAAVAADDVSLEM
jgi:hypothetical protein